MRHESASTLTLDQAYQAAYLWMFHAGQPPVEIVERGAQGVELHSEETVALVRVPAHPLNQRTVLAVLATESDGRTRLIFSSAGFTAGAISIAEAQGIALFSLNFEGTALPENRPAASISHREEPPPPFAKEQNQVGLTLSKEAWGSGEHAADEWVNCSGCGKNQHRTLDTCRICGASLSKTEAPEESPDTIVYRCTDCGSLNVEGVVPGDTPRHIEAKGTKLPVAGRRSPTQIG